jgi:hypothetical protein
MGKGFPPPGGASIAQADWASASRLVCAAWLAKAIDVGELDSLDELVVLADE